jgi:outer membrane protein OmpA-like peptidoglycan-associated protein
MPLYYNTGAPVGGNSNSITITAKDLGLRDFLLSRNIQNPIRYPQLPTSVNGSPRGGEPFLDTMVGSGVVIPQVPIEVDGLFRYSIAILPNHYKDTDPAAPLLLSIDTVLASHPTGYPISPNGTLDYSQEDHTQYGIVGVSNYYEFRKNSTKFNLYLDATKQVDMADLISLQPIQATQQLPSYDQAWGQLTIGGQNVTKAANVIGSVLNGQGVGIGNGGLSTNFDIRSSLAGRVLGATGLLNDTKLGIVGGQQLALALANNAAFNVEQEILGTLNLRDNLLSLVKNGNLAGFRPSYKITVPSTLGGKIVNVAEKVLGFQVPRSYLQDTGSLFSSENGNISNIERANNMILNTGKGQIKSLLANITASVQGTDSKNDNPETSPFRSGYVPGYKDNKGEKLIDPKGYAFMTGEGLITNFLVPTDGIIPDLNWNREQLVDDAGFKLPSNTNVDFLPNPGIPIVVTNTLTDTYGNGVTHISKPTFSWVASQTDGPEKPLNATPLHIGGKGDKKTLLGKTQMLFNSKGMRNLVSVKGDMTIGYGSQLQTSVVNGGISKGSAVLKGDLFDANGNITNASNEAENTFCRSWTTFDRYDRVYKLIRNRGLNQNEGTGGPIFPEGNKWRLKTQGSVLDDNGFVKIAPYKTDDLTRSASDPKKYMFSIENLAWAGSPAANLLPVEQGPGDLTTGKFGRIMWFPPYDLTFSETSSISLETTSFIGRGEPIYTYNNTERTGSLSFKIIIDHPSIMNAFKGPAGPPDEFIRSWYAGCVDLDPKWANLLTKEEIAKQEVKKQQRVEKKEIKAAKAPDEIKIYFPNDVTKIETVLVGANYLENPPNGCQGPYENGDGYGIGDYNGEQQQKKENGPFVDSPEFVPKSRQTKNGGDGLKLWPDNTDFGLNGPENKLGINGKDYTNQYGWTSANYIADLKAYLNPSNPKDGCPTCKAVCTGYASSQGTGYPNQQLLKHRAESMKEWLISQGILDASRISIDIAKSKVKSGKFNADTSVDTKEVKLARYGAIIFVNDAKDEKIDVTTEIEVPVQVSLNQQVKRRYYNEADFFEKLKQTDPLVFDTIKQKIRYFDPAFHSMTPEGFNSRLTFLLQCTRQGPTIAESGPANLAFGPQPVCILRIGDFYNTKIMMDNLSIDYEPLVWDLNPEGVGVQPMIANVTISFKYIGGSSLYSPINKLQNALSFNYFANTQVYDPRADYVAKVSDIKKDNPDLYNKLSNKSPDRSTFGDKNPDAKTEPNYALVPGLDSTKTSMGAMNPNEITSSENNNNNVKDGDQAKANDAATSTANNPAGQAEMARIKLTDVQCSTLNWGQYGSASFIISRTDPNDNKSLNANYDLTVNIKGKELTSDIFKIKLPKQLDGSELGTQNFSFDLADMTPTCTGLTLTSSSYSFEVLVGDIGSLNATIDKISGGTTATTATTTTSTIAGDEGIFEDAKLTGKWGLFSVKIEDDGKLTGKFIILNNADGLKADHAAKISLVTKMGTLIEIASFTIDGTPNGPSRGQGIGYFTSKSNDMRTVLELGKEFDKDDTNYLPFVITIPEYPNLKYYSYKYGYSEYDCPEESIKYGTIILVQDMKYIYEDFCNRCYPNGTGGKKIIFNGVTCSTTGSTNATTGTDEISKSGSFIAENCDKAHNFNEMIGEINDAQNELYNKGINPKVTKLTVKIYPYGKSWSQDWDFTVSKSTDGKAWTGFVTRGSCGKQKCEDTGVYYDYIERADGQYNGTSNTCIVAASSPCYNKSLEQCMKDSLNAVDWNLVTTYQNDTDQFKQYFAQFTKSDKPAK